MQRRSAAAQGVKPSSNVAISALIPTDLFSDSAVVGHRTSSRPASQLPDAVAERRASLPTLRVTNPPVSPTPVRKPREAPKRATTPAKQSNTDVDRRFAALETTLTAFQASTTATNVNILSRLEQLISTKASVPPPSAQPAATSSPVAEPVPEPAARATPTPPSSPTHLSSSTFVTITPLATFFSVLHTYLSAVYEPTSHISQCLEACCVDSTMLHLNSSPHI